MSVRNYVPHVMTLKQFKEMSTPTNIFKRGRGKALQLIDHHLDVFENAPAGSISAPHRMLQLQAEYKLRVAWELIQACRAWLDLKKDKASQYTTLRRDAILRLGTQVFEWIKFQEAQSRKFQNPNGAQNLREMRPGYTPEREHYERLGKQSNPISGSYMHAVLDSRANQNVRNQQHPLNQKNFATLTVQDYVNLDAAYSGRIPSAQTGGRPANPGSMSKLKVARQVLFLNKRERVRRLVIIENGVAYDGFDAPIDCEFGLGLAYAIDEYGNFFCSSNEFESKTTKSNLSFNHSTLNAGKAVICAGTFKCDNGVFTEITNASGHYKPNRENLHNAVGLLGHAGVDLTRVKVIVREADPQRPGKVIEHEYRNGLNFLQNRNAPPDESFPEP